MEFPQETTTLQKQVNTLDLNPLRKHLEASVKNGLDRYEVFDDFIRCLRSQIEATDPDSWEWFLVVFEGAQDGRAKIQDAISFLDSIAISFGSEEAREHSVNLGRILREMSEAL